MSYRVFDYYYTPVIIGARKRYRLELPLGASPRPYKTMTTGMQAWHGEVLEAVGGRATALVAADTSVQGEIVGAIRNGGPCVVMEHINIDGNLEYMIGDKDILAGNINFVNFGIPNGKHLRIDVYTGESKVINGDL